MRYVELKPVEWWERILFGGDVAEVCDLETGEAFFASRSDFDRWEAEAATYAAEEAAMRRGEVW